MRYELHTEDKECRLASEFYEYVAKWAGSNLSVQAARSTESETVAIQNCANEIHRVERHPLFFGGFINGF